MWFRPILHATHYELGDERRNPDRTTATVPVRITAPNLPLWERTLDAQAGNDGSPSELAQGSLDTGTYPRVTYDDRIFLVKEHHHWRVAAGFAARDRALDQHRQAVRDFYEGQLDDVIARYHSIIAGLEHESGTGNLSLATRLRAELGELETIKSEMPATAAYRAKLKLANVTMQMAEERVPAIFGQVSNFGGRPIDDLRLTVNWYQGRGRNLKLVHREDHSIVLTPIEFTEFSRSVIPFLPGETRQFGFLLSAPPEVEQNAAPYVNIGSIAFSQIPAPLPKLEAASAHLAPATPVTSSPRAVPSKATAKR